MVATEENKKSYVGSKLGGYSETLKVQDVGLIDPVIARITPKKP